MIVQHEVVTFLTILGSSHGMRNELSLRLKWLDIPVQCSRVRLPRGEIEWCDGSAIIQLPLLGEMRNACMLVLQVGVASQLSLHLSWLTTPGEWLIIRLVQIDLAAHAPRAIVRML